MEETKVIGGKVSVAGRRNSVQVALHCFMTRRAKTTVVGF